MSHLTSSWAFQYCLVDPARAADELLAADDAAARAADATLRSVSVTTGLADHPLGLARRAISHSWSAEQPCNAAHALIEAHRTVSDACGRASGVARNLAAAITAAHDAVRGAYAAADATIAAQQLREYSTTVIYPYGPRWPSAVVTPEERHRVDSGRQAVIAALDRAIRAAAQRLDADAIEARHRLGDDPWSGLPGFAQPAVPHGAADSDHLNRQALLDDLVSSSSARRELAAAVSRALDDAAAQGQTAQLLVYDPDDPPTQGSVAIAIGNVDAATNVAVVVPGVGNSPATIGDSIPAAGLLNDEIIAQAGSAQGTAATVLWWGYDIPISWPDDPTPDSGGLSREEMISDTVLAMNAFGAATAGKRLAAFTATLRTAMPAAAQLTLIGHSWGSMVVSQAALRMGKDEGVDYIVEIGSPGAGYQIETARDYSAVDADHVYAVALPKDPVPLPLTDIVADFPYPMNPLLRRRIFGVDTGPFGPDPANEAFGARVIDVPSEHRSRLPLSIGTHALSNYLSGESLSAVAAVAAGKGSDIPLRRPK